MSADHERISFVSPGWRVEVSSKFGVVILSQNSILGQECAPAVRLSSSDLLGLVEVLLWIACRDDAAFRSVLIDSLRELYLRRLDSWLQRPASASLGFLLESAGAQNRLLLSQQLEDADERQELLISISHLPFLVAALLAAAAKLLGDESPISNPVSGSN
jgi:hypothetical protein